MEGKYFLSIPSIAITIFTPPLLPPLPPPPPTTTSTITSSTTTTSTTTTTTNNNNNNSNGHSYSAVVRELCNNPVSHCSNLSITCVYRMF